MGSYIYSVDSKGRINIPSKLRKEMPPEAEKKFVITRGYDGCLFLYPFDEWAKVAQDAKQLTKVEPDNRLYQRKLAEIATDAKLDAQSRIVLTKDLLQHAAIENDVLIIGVLDHIEVWNPQKYKEYVAAHDESFDSVAQTVLKK
jgi:MraZ protein